MDTNPEQHPIEPFDDDAITHMQRRTGTIQAVLRELVPEGLPERSDDALILATVQAMGVLSREVEAIQIRLMREIEARNSGPAEDSITWRHGCRSTTELVRQLTHESVTSLKRRRNLALNTALRRSLTGEALEAQFDAVRQALDMGLINHEQAGVITSEVGKLPDQLEPYVRRGAELFFTALAAGLPTPERIHDYSLEDLIAVANDPRLDDEAKPRLPVAPDALRRQAAAWRHVLDPDGTLPTEERVARLFLRFRTLSNGNVHFEGEITAEHAALWKQQLDAINSPLSPNTLSTEVRDEIKRDEHDSGVNDSPDFETETKQPVRFQPACETEIADDAPPTGNCAPTVPKLSREQRAHDAFVAMLVHKVQAGALPTSGGAPITVLTIVNESGEQPATTGWVTTPLGAPSAVSMDQVAHFGCAGATQRLTLNDRGAVVNLSTTSRIFSNPQRKAIAARDGTCVMPGCEIGAYWCEIHHVTPWHSGGRTTIDNGVALCWRHHSTIDHSGWQIEMRNGIPWVRPPKWLDASARWQSHLNPMLR